jgi:AraC family transcriptional regulator
MMKEPQKSHAPAVKPSGKARWEGISLKHFRSRAGDLPEHRHRQHLVIISLGRGGKAEIRTENGFHLRGNQIPGSVCVLPAGLAHRALIDEESEHLALYLEPDLVRRAASESRLSARLNVVEKYSPSDPVISSIGMALLAEAGTEGLSGRLYAESLANVLAVHLFRYYTSEGSAPLRLSGGLSGQKLRQVLAFIGDNYTSDLRLAELAQVADMSSFHFAREFKRTTGTTPHQYLIEFRIERAKALLVNSELPLVQVGLQSGFSHQSHFTRLFHRFTGTTPQSYRLRQQAE